MMKCKRIFPSTLILIALIVAILACTVSIEAMDNVMLIAKFFDVMLPILAVGALVKYLMCGGKNSCCCCNKNNKADSDTCCN